jgi:HK97 family phage major capsid protein
MSTQGHPDSIVVSHVLPDYSNVAMLFFGDHRKAAKFGRRRDTRIQVLEELYADYDQLVIKATERYDVVVRDRGDTSTAGPLVALVGE